MSEESFFPGEPHVRWELPYLERFLVWMSEVGASDMKMAPGRPIWIRRNSEWLVAGRKVCSPEEVAQMVNETYRSQDASERATTGSGVDYSFEVVEGGTDAGAHDFDPHAAQAKHYRFRVNATGAQVRLATGIEITMRSIPEEVPTTSKLNLPSEIVEACTPTNGLVLIAGTMGSGKSTTLAALIRHILETRRWSIATYEDPIEFDFQNVADAKGPVAQTEVPRIFRSFEEAAWNAVRRAEDVVLLGESRSPQTVDSMLQISEIGSVVFSTLHARSVIDTPGRLINMFPERERAKVGVRFATAVRLIIYQRLVPRIDPSTGEKKGRIALIEYLPIDNDLNTKLAGADLNKFGDVIQEAFSQGKGRTLAAHARELYGEGLMQEMDYKAATRLDSDVVL